MNSTYEELIEKVARDIHPNAFRQYDSLYQYCLNSGDTEVLAKDCADVMHGNDCENARAKATAAIATIREVLSEPTPVMLREIQMKSEIGADICANWSGAYSCIEELWRVGMAASPLVEEER